MRVDKIYEQLFAGQTNPYTGRPITSEADFQAYQAEKDRRERESQLQKAGIAPETIGQMVRQQLEPMQQRLQMAELAAAQDIFRLLQIPAALDVDTFDKGKVNMNNFTIDIGASSAKEAEEEFHIRIGEPVVPDVRFSYDEAHDLMLGKAFDCRLGCAAIVKTLDILKGEALSVNVAGAWACQEEVGTRGAEVTCNRVKPDVAIVFEGCPADDTVVEPYMVQTALKKGPMLRFIDRRMITHPRFQRLALDLARENGIPVQEAVRSSEVL